MRRLACVVVPAADLKHSPVTPEEFAAALGRLGPWAAARPLAVALSGGADSSALMWLAGTQRPRGDVVGLIVDHGLRPESASEAALVYQRFSSLGFSCQILTLSLPQGGGMAARAREARYAALVQACRARGIVDLLLGHHLLDQVETALIRQESHSGAMGLAGMAAIRGRDGVRLLRPLLHIPPERLRATLNAAGVPWEEDPGNLDPRRTRSRWRLHLNQQPEMVTRLHAQTLQAGKQRAWKEWELAQELARYVALAPQGYALLRAGLSAPALAAVLRTISGAAYPPSMVQVQAWLRKPRPATLHSCQILRARPPHDWLVVREVCAMAAPVEAQPGVTWDGRFRLGKGLPQGIEAWMGALGIEATAFRRYSSLPVAVLRTLPTLRVDGNILAVPHLDIPGQPSAQSLGLRFAPSAAMAGAPFAIG